MKRIIWKEGRVFSIQLRNGQYALLQMLSQKGKVAVFDCFREKDVWDDLKLNPSNVLFFALLLKSILHRSPITIHKTISPVGGLVYPHNPKIDIGNGFREMTLWEGTENRRTFLMMGDGNNSLRHIYREAGQIREEYTSIPLEDYDKYKDVELTNVSDYPEFNERLYLCSIFRRNINPLKEIAFNRPIEIEYCTYIDIIAGKTKLSELGY